MADDSEFSRRRFLQATGGTASAVALAGCLGGSDGESGNNGSSDAGTSGGSTNANATRRNIEADPSKTLEMVNSTITTFDPIAVNDTASGVVAEQLFDGLMQYPNGLPEVDGAIAADYRTSDDFRIYTFDLKEAQFHNGDPVRAQDFVYSWERLAGSENSEQSYFILDSLGVTHQTDSEGSYQPGTLGLNAVDDRTLEITLEEPFHAVLEMLAYSAFATVPEGVVGDVPNYQGRLSYGEFSTQNPIGAGPFSFDNWQQGTEVSVTRFDEYHGDIAQVAGVHWQIIEDYNAIYEYFMNRNADFLASPSLPTAQYDPSKVSVQRTDDRGRQFGTYGPLRNGATAQYLSVPLINTYYIGFNMQAVEKPVRQAFAYAANQQLFVEQVFKGRGKPAYHLIPPSIYPGGSQAYERSASQDYPYGYNQSQLEQARRVMEQAGYGENNRLQLSWLQYESNTWNRMARIIRDQLASVYIDMQIQQAPFATLLERTTNGNAEVYTLGWVADWPAPDNCVQLLNPPQTDTSQPAPISCINWSQQTGSAAGRAAQAYQRVEGNLQPTDQAEQARNEACITMEQANWEDVGILPLYHVLNERLSYGWVQIPPHGGMGTNLQKFNHARIAQQRN